MTAPSPNAAKPRIARIGVALASVLIPALAVWLGIVFQRAEGPRWVRERYDPDYCYLLNAVNLAEGLSPFYTGHPGTPVIEIGAGVLTVRHWCSSNPGTLREQVLANPESALDAITIVLRAIHFAALVTLGHWARRFTGSYLCAMAAQAITLSSFLIISAMHRMNPEILLLSISILLSAASLRAIQRPGPVWRRFAIVSGALVGIGVATKVTFAPITLLPLGLLIERGRRGWGQRLTWAASGLIAFLICISPILSGWERASTWFWHLIVRDGQYGSSTGHLIVNPDTYATNLVRMALSERITYGTALVGALVTLVAIFRRRSLDDRGRRSLAMLISTVAAIIAQDILVAKHPGPRYLMPAVGASGLCLCLIVDVLRGLLTQVHIRIIGAAAAACITAALAWCLWTTPARLKYFRADRETRVQVWNEAQARIAQGGTLCSSYGASSPAYALIFSDEWSGYKFTADFKRMFPWHIIHNIWAKGFYIGSERIPDERIKALANEGRLYLQCLPNNRPAGFICEPITRDPNPEVLYRLRVAPPPK